MKWGEELDYADIYSEKISLDNYENAKIIVEDFCLERSDEIYLLSEKFYGEDGKDWVCELVNGIESVMNPQNDEEMEEGEKLQKMSKWEKFSCFKKDGDKKCEDPENFAGRLPRIFIWSDAYPDLDTNSDENANSGENANSDKKVISKKMEQLLIQLPAKWRKDDADEKKRHILSKNLVDTIANTASEKSWQKRRCEIEKKIRNL